MRNLSVYWKLENKLLGVDGDGHGGGGGGDDADVDDVYTLVIMLILMKVTFSIYLVFLR